MSTTLVQIQVEEKRFRAHQVIDRLALDIRAGEIVSQPPGDLLPMIKPCTRSKLAGSATMLAAICLGAEALAQPPGPASDS